MWYELLKMSLQGMNIGLAGDVESSGEENVCRMLAESGKIKTIFDVGANVGEYAKILKKYFDTAKIYCFEPAKETFRILKDNVGEAENVILNNMGFSDKAGWDTLYYDTEASGLASLYKRQLDYINIDLAKSEEVQIETLDRYCVENDIQEIDFLKMDIEGNELNALEGGKNLLREKRIGVIQIEFGGCNIDSRTFFRDFWNLLHEEYDVYRILKNGLWKIQRYSERLECFTTTNYLFVRKELKEWISDL